MSTADPGEETPQEPEFPDDVNLAWHCVLENNPTRFAQFFENEEDPYKEKALEHLNQRNDEGKSPLDLSSTLGRLDMTKELITRGGEVNSSSCQGYIPLHRAAAWGRIDVLKLLVDNGADLQQKTVHGERAREVALRYNHAECVDYLDWAEAKVFLQDTIRAMQETLADPEKIQGRLTKDDRNICMNACKEKSDWVDLTVDATTQDFILKKQELDEIFAPIWVKLSEPRKFHTST
ncbi:ankyrin repeat domain-containing protein 45 [Lingula anatina]|uniref:Ankyrin repeat domain-containing protein 45 n=1 Tax=Lingula anatina TaxID=7574 RepID=A0A1S3JTV0_LINAN|nr:ankyrin repeat domain-containing protein 45 [Lingula anatina]|eukprot:XP_013413753.1 ankyrin repeat domain-containing protein 45 [Lingula anatina]